MALLGLYFCRFDCPNSWVHYNYKPSTKFKLRSISLIIDRGNAVTDSSSQALSIAVSWVTLITEALANPDCSLGRNRLPGRSSYVRLEVSDKIITVARLLQLKRSSCTISTGRR